MYKKIVSVVITLMFLALFGLIANAGGNTAIRLKFLPILFSSGNNETNDTLGTIKNRGFLICGVNTNLLGFGFADENEEISGFDIDFCAAIAAAVFGDEKAYQLVPTNASNRFSMLQSGEIDVLIRNTTWTVSRDTSLGLNFAPTTFFDGQGMMVRETAGIVRLEDLNGGTICVTAGTSTEKKPGVCIRKPWYQLRTTGI